MVAAPHGDRKLGRSFSKVIVEVSDCLGLLQIFLKRDPNGWITTVSCFLQHMSRAAKGTQKRSSHSQASLAALLTRRRRAGPCHMDFLQRWSNMSRCKFKPSQPHYKSIQGQFSEVA